MPINPGNSALANDERIFKHLYHGTTEEKLPGIMKHGIKAGPPDGYAYVTTRKKVADYHANRVYKDSGHKPVVLKLDPSHPSLKGLKLDETDNSYPNGKSFPIHMRESFKSPNNIHPEAIKEVHR